MPQVFKRKWMTKDGRERTSKMYYCRYQVNGRDYLRSTGTTSFAEAKAEMDRMRLAAREGTTLDRATKQFREAVKELPEEQRIEARIDVAKILFWELQNVLRVLPDGIGLKKEMAMREIGWVRNMVLVLLLAVGSSAVGAEEAIGWIDPLDETVAQRDERMQWWRAAKFGLFIHWGVYSVPAGTYEGEPVKGIGEWIMYRAKIPVAEYKGYAKAFNPVKYDPDAWVRMAKAAGVKYIVITSKHHDGFALFGSKASDWNVVDATPYGKDLLRPLETACKKYGIHLGFYYSQAQDWINPGGGKARMKEGEYWDVAQKGDFDQYLKEVAVPQVREILSGYDIDVLWWDTPSWMNKERADLLRPLLKLKPGLITNNRLGGGYKGDMSTPEQKIPATGLDSDWESCMTMNHTWGYKSYDHDWKSTETLVRNLIDIVSKGGNFLLNVGPTALGEIPPASIERLEGMGRWMDANGAAIYGTTASPFRKLDWGRCTQKKGTLFLHVFDWPKDGVLVVPGLRNTITSVRLLASGTKLSATRGEGEWRIALPATMPDPIATAIEVSIDGKADVDPLYPSNASDGLIPLSLRMADLEQHGYGEKMKIVREEGGEFIKNWKEHKASVAWAFINLHAGAYTLVADLRIDQPAGRELELVLQIDQGKKAFHLLSGMEVNRWTTLELGQLEVPKGIHTLHLKRKPIKGKWPDLQLRKIRLVPGSAPRK